jgi:hypothetical protein
VGPVGSFQEAEFELRAGVPAGNYHVACDSIILAPTTVRFTLSWRHADGAADTTLSTWTKAWTPLPGGVYDAQAYEVDQAAPAITFEPGDGLIFRYEGIDAGTTNPQAFIPNGDGARTMGRIPSITLPR